MQEKQKKMILRISMYLIGIVILACGITMNTKTKPRCLSDYFDALCGGTDLGI